MGISGLGMATEILLDDTLYIILIRFLFVYCGLAFFLQDKDINELNK